MINMNMYSYTIYPQGITVYQQGNGYNEWDPQSERIPGLVGILVAMPSKKK